MPGRSPRRGSKQTRGVVRKRAFHPIGSGAAILQPGPRKPRIAGRQPIQLSTHKKRATWFQARASWPMRDAPIHTLQSARSAAGRGRQAPPASPWESLGPTNIGGRITSLACHPNDAGNIWAGSAGGGVWHSSDGGRTWLSQWHSEGSLNIGALALDARNPALIYCGTGEANLSADSYPGVGLFRSEDGGATWHVLAESDTTGIPRRIGTLAVDPFDSNHLRLGGIGFNEVSATGHELGGLYGSRDGGITWTREEFISKNNYWCHSVVFDPVTPGRLYATITEQGTKSGIWRSSDGGHAWEPLRNGLPPPESFGRTALAVSPSSPNVIYAFAQNEGSQDSDLLLGVFRSDQHGDVWSDITGDQFGSEGQISYGNAIAVHPTDSQTVICGGVDLHLTRDGGKNWNQVTRWDADRGDNNYAHADHHALLMPAASPGFIYSGNDGGVDLSADTGGTWQNRSNGLAITMYYDIDVCQADPHNFGGGAQDNGTLVTMTGGRDDHREILGGDGGWMVYDPQDASHLYASFYNMGIYRFREGQKPTDVSPPTPESASIWMCYITLDPANSSIVYTGSNRVWKTEDDAQAWSAISPPLDGSPISAIEVAPADSKRLYIGTENGGFFRSTDAGQTWSANLASAILPGHVITRLETSGKTGEDVVFATIANFGHSHLFVSRDGGLTWEDSDKGQLPDAPHHAVVIHPDVPTTVYTCSDAGVFVSADGGVTWANMSGDLPTVMVVDLVYSRSDASLYAATYGRGIWRTGVRTPAKG
jgi:photosystem II stability/assembly factor-like uncharacterized protein